MNQRKLFAGEPADHVINNNSATTAPVENVDMPSSFEQLIQREVTKFDVVVPAVNELAEKYIPLKIQSIEDKEGYAEVSKALRFIVSKRTAVEDKRKELKADSLAYGRAVDARAKEITLMLEPIESHLKNEKERIDNEIERLRIEEEERLQKVINDRITVLVELGMFQTMTEFVWKSKLNPIEEVTFLRSNLELFTNEDFEAFTIELKNSVEYEDNVIEERDREAKAKLEELERERKKIQDERIQLEQDVKDMREQRAIMRTAELAEMGLSNVPFHNYWIYIDLKGFGDMYSTVAYDEVYSLSKIEWDSKIQILKAKISEKLIETFEEATPPTTLIESKAVAGVSSAFDSPAKIEVAANSDKPAASEKETYLDYISQLKSVPAPQLKTKKWQNQVNTLVKTIDTFYNMS